MAHVDIHQGSAREEVVGFCGNDCDVVFAKFSDKAGCGNTANAISEDGDMHAEVGFTNVVDDCLYLQFNKTGWEEEGKSKINSLEL
jgi:hypothetical protein